MALSSSDWYVAKNKIIQICEKKFDNSGPLFVYPNFLFRSSPCILCRCMMVVCISGKDSIIGKFHRSCLVDI